MTAERLEDRAASHGGPEGMPVVVHVTSHHAAFDPRIFHECRALAAAGFRTFLVAPHERDEVRDEVRILAIPRYRNRFERVFSTAPRAVRTACRLDPAILHFHDPELLPWALWLALRGRRVIYDIHEDFATAAMDRSWVPTFLRLPLAGAVRFWIRLVDRSLPTIIAERYYRRFAPHAVEVLNYARISAREDVMGLKRRFRQTGRPRLIYTGSITESRGGRIHLALARGLPSDGRVFLIGRCPEASLLNELRDFAARDSRLELRAGPGWVAWDEIVEAYTREWTAGVALFPDTAHYREKELTKFFEYMAAGLPVLCSNFPVWRELVEGNGAGICVDPEDIEAAVRAALWLSEHPAEAAAMGERGRRLVRERYNWESQADRLIAYYRTLLDQGR